VNDVTPLQQWSPQDLETWVADVMGLPDVATAMAGDVDGAMTVDLTRADWMELGAVGMKSAKIISELKKLRSAM
jgi:hypothetical protein